MLKGSWNVELKILILLIFLDTQTIIFDQSHKKTPDGTHILNGSWVQHMENFKETQYKFGENPKLNKRAIPVTIEPTI